MKASEIQAGDQLVSGSTLYYTVKAVELVQGEVRATVEHHPDGGRDVRVFSPDADIELMVRPELG